MKIALPVLQKCLHGAIPETVLHVGAHQAEEADLYLALGAREIHWVEAQPDLCFQMREELDPKANFVYNAAVWSKGGLEKELVITNNSQSTSLFSLKGHLDAHPEVQEISRLKVTTARLDEFLPHKKFDIINIDIQGAELHALEGLGDLIGETRLIYLEVNKAELYEDIDLVPVIDRFLEARGFRRVVTRWVPRKGWGEAIYVPEASVSVVLVAKFTNMYYFARDILSKLGGRFFSLRTSVHRVSSKSQR